MSPSKETYNDLLRVQVNTLRPSLEARAEEKKLYMSQISQLLEKSSMWPLTQTIINKNLRRAGQEPKITLPIDTKTSPVKIHTLIDAANHIYTYNLQKTSNSVQASEITASEINLLFENELNRRIEIRTETVKAMLEKTSLAHLAAQKWVNTLKLTHENPKVKDNDQLLMSLAKIHYLNLWKYGVNNLEHAVLDTAKIVSEALGGIKVTRKPFVVFRK